VARSLIDDFWIWWDGAKDGFATEVGDTPERAELERRIDQLGDGIGWEIGPGLVAEHMLCVTAANQIERRAAVARLMRAAPAGDATWEYHETRPAKAIAGLALTVAGVSLPLAETRVRFDGVKGEQRLDVRLDHPAFAQLPDAEHDGAGLLLLDTALGELGVERYVGAIEMRSMRRRAQGIDRLVEAVEKLHRERQSDRATGGSSWSSQRGRVDGVPLVRTLDGGVLHCEHPLLDAHIHLDIGLLDPTELGFTTNAEAATLYEAEDAIKAELGENAVFIARDTTAGIRRLHFYFDRESDALDVIERHGLMLKSEGREMSARHNGDPGWEFARSIGLR
jgi:Family of unknown function (DUF695)